MAEDLYGLSLDEFTAARNGLARELAKDGDSTEAERVKALRKPSVPAWLVNQLVRRRKKASKDLLRAGERLRSAQEKALEGGGRNALEKAVAAERKAVEALVGEARDLGEEGGVNVSAATLNRVQSTLHAVSLDPEVREAFEAGDLTEDHEATGVDALALMAVPAGKGRGTGRRGAKKGESAAARKRAREAEAEVQRIEDDLASAERELNSAKERVRQLEGRLARARKAAKAP